MEVQSSPTTRPTREAIHSTRTTSVVSSPIRSKNNVPLRYMAYNNYSYSSDDQSTVSTSRRPLQTFAPYKFSSPREGRDFRGTILVVQCSESSPTLSLEHREEFDEASFSSLSQSDDDSEFSESSKWMLARGLIAKLASKLFASSPADRRNTHEWDASSFFFTDDHAN